MRKLFHFLGLMVICCMCMLHQQNCYAAVLPQDVNANTNIDANGEAAGCRFIAPAGAATTLTVTDGASVNSKATNIDAITNGTANNNRGTVTFDGNSTVWGDIGNDVANRKVSQINANGAAGKTVSFEKATGSTGNINANNNLSFGGDCTVSLADGIVFNKGVQSAIAAAQGTLLLNGSSEVSGAGLVGNPIKEVQGGTAGGVAVLGGNFWAETAKVIGTGTLNFQDDFTDTNGGTGINFDADGKVDVNSIAARNITANVTTSNNNTGTLSFRGDAIMTGDVGGAGKALKLIEVGAINANKTVNFTGHVVASTLNFVQNGNKVIIAAGNNLTAAVTTNTNDKGTLTFNGTSIVTGQVGTSGAVLSLVEAGAAGTATFNNDIFATKLDVTGNGTVGLSGNMTGTINYTAAAVTGEVKVADGKNVGVVTTNTSGQGTLTFLGATTTGGNIGTTGPLKKLAAVNFNGATSLGHNVRADTITIAPTSASTVTLTGDRTMDGNLTLFANNGAVLNVGTNTLNLNGTGIYTQNAGSTFRVGVDGANSGKINADGPATVNIASALAIDVVSYVPNNTTVKIINGAAGGTIAVPATITSSSPMYTFAGTKTGGGNDISITATRANSFNTVASGNAAAAGAVLESVAAAGASGDMLTVINDLDSLPTTSDVAKALSTVVPVVDGAVNNTSFSAMSQFVNTAVNRLENMLARNFTITGIATGGDYLKGVEAWAQGFGDYAHQDERGASNGYNASVWGTAVGIDAPAHNDDIRLGISGGFAQSFVRSKDNCGRTDIDSYQGTLYWGYRDPNHPYYLDCALSFAYNKYDGSRHIALGGTERIPLADYDGQQYSALTGFGYIFNIRNVMFTPLASIQYMHLRVNSYTEEEAGALNLHVDGQDFDMLQGGIGAKCEYPMKTRYGTFIPELHIKWLYDFIGDTQATTSSFSGGGGSFATTGFTPAQSTYDFGAKVSLFTKNNFTIEANYDFQFKEDYWENTGWVTVSYRI